MLWWCLISFVSIDSVLTIDSIESRVFSGDDLRFEVHKHLVKIKFHRNEGRAYCSGSIVDSSWVITSAHCLRGNEKQVTVFHQTSEGQKVIAKVNLAKIQVHPLWDPYNNSMENRAYDVALLNTRHPIKFNDDIQAIKLSTIHPMSDHSAIIAGFGESEPDLDPPREGFVKVFSCFNMLLCSRDLARAGSGDSGGSLLSAGKLLGVTSASCKQVQQQKPCVTVYASVPAHYRWIQEIMYSSRNKRVL